MLETEIMMEKVPHPIRALGRERQVLVVDDNKTVRKAVTRILISSGYKVTPAGNGYAGGILFLTRSFDLAIIDLNMPQMKVWQLSRIFKTHSPNTPVIVATGFSNDKPWRQVDHNWVDATIQKPFTLKEIEGIVRRLLNSGM
jgi:CheY-like chemotaxis protein